MLHGAGDNARDWSYVLPLLDRSRRVLAPDLPGIGELAIAMAGVAREPS